MSECCFFRCFWMLGVLEILLCAVGIGSAGIIVSSCVLLHSLVSTRCIFKMNLMVDASTIKREMSFCRRGLSAPGLARRDRSSAVLRFTRAPQTTSKLNSVRRTSHCTRRCILLIRLRIYLRESWSVRVVSRVPFT